MPPTPHWLDDDTVMYWGETVAFIACISANIRPGKLTMHTLLLHILPPWGGTPIPVEPKAQVNTLPPKLLTFTFMECPTGK